MRAPGIGPRQALHDVAAERNKPIFIQTKGKSCQRKMLIRPLSAVGSKNFWGKTCDLTIVDEIAAPDMLLKYSLHEPRRGHADIKAFMTDFRKAFPDLYFWGSADLIAEGDYVVGQWDGGGTHTGPAFNDFIQGSLPANTGRKMRFTGITILKVVNGKIVEENGLDDGVTALTQLGILRDV